MERSRSRDEAGSSLLVENVKERLRSMTDKDGTGIILPGDINSLRSCFQLVCLERAAGNITATTPEIVAIFG